MEAYTDFASVYDTFMDETPYEEWADFIVEQIEKYGVSKPCKADKEKETETGKDKKKDKKAGKKEADKKEETKPLIFDLENCRDRIIRLTRHSSRLGDAVLTKKGDKLYYQATFEGGFDLWWKIRFDLTPLAMSY